MSGLEVPPTIASAVTARWGEAGQAWVDHVIDELDELCATYRATPTMLMPARYGLVLAVETPWGERVFKSTPDPNGAAQVATARALGRLSAGPTVRESRITATSTWTVMDRVIPGRSIREAPSTPATVDRLAELVHTYEGKPPPRPAMPALADWLAARLRDDVQTDLPIGRTVAPAADRRAALRILEDLTAQSLQASLIHGDPSAGNIILDAQDRPRLIDPRGVAGDHVYDVAAMAAKLARHLPAMPGVKMFAKSVGVDPERAEAWAAVATAARV